MDELLRLVSRTAIDPALAILPTHMDSPRARVMLLAIGLQESGMKYRRQMLDGPARGLWQFEPGSKASKGGVWGVYLHSQTMELLRLLCRARDCGFEPRSIWTRIETDDVLAAGLARLLLWTDRKPLPEVADEHGAWELYADRCWRPGKPHPEKWPANHARAVAFVKES
jgi:hypothetical protein